MKQIYFWHSNNLGNLSSLFDLWWSAGQSSSLTWNDDDDEYLRQNLIELYFTWLHPLYLSKCNEHCWIIFRNIIYRGFVLLNRNVLLKRMKITGQEENGKTLIRSAKHEGCSWFLVLICMYHHHHHLHHNSSTIPFIPCWRLRESQSDNFINKTDWYISDLNNK